MNEENQNELENSAFCIEYADDISDVLDTIMEDIFYEKD